MKQLTAQDLLAMPAGDIKSLELPELGGTVYIRELGAFEFERVLERSRSDDGERSTVEMAKHLLAASICDEKGNALFTPDQAAELANKSRKIVSKLVAEAFQVNFATEADLGNSNATADDN